jgi:hypothetical protein
MLTRQRHQHLTVNRQLIRLPQGFGTSGPVVTSNPRSAKCRCNHLLARDHGHPDLSLQPEYAARRPVRLQQRQQPGLQGLSRSSGPLHMLLPHPANAFDFGFMSAKFCRYSAIRHFAYCCTLQRAASMANGIKLSVPEAAFATKRPMPPQQRA